MKRRTFLTAAATVGAVGAASSATVVSSVYNTINLNILLEEFDPAAKTILDKFVSDIAENAEDLGLDKKMAKKMAMPTRIVSNNLSGKQKSIVYRNAFDQTISISTSKDAKHEVIIKTL